MLFKTGNADIDAATGERMAELAALLTAQPGVTLAIDGYADERGDESFNLELSRERAEAVVTALTSYGVPAEKYRSTRMAKSAGKEWKATWTPTYWSAVSPCV